VDSNQRALTELSMPLEEIKKKRRAPRRSPESF
jgi:hypothetical protein